MGQSHVLDGKMTLEQSGKLANVLHDLVDLINLPYGKKGKLNYDRVIEHLQKLKEKDGRFQGWQREPFWVEIARFSNEQEHLDIIEKLARPGGGLYCKDGIFANMYHLPNHRLPDYVPFGQTEAAFHCIVVSPEEMGFQKKRIPFYEVVLRGTGCGLYAISPAFAPQALATALKKTQLVVDFSLMAASKESVFGIRSDEPSRNYKYMMSFRPNEDFAVDNDQRILWRIVD